MTNTPVFDDRWDRIEELFNRAADLPADEVAAFCARECGDDEELHRYVLELLAADTDDTRLRQSVNQLSAEMAADSSLTGTRLGAYEVGEVIGRGGMGEVYAAARADGQFEKKVAVKIVHQTLNKDEFLGHFQTELQVLATLQHPYIPTLIDAGRLDDGRLYFLADYVDGRPIDQYCVLNGLTTKQRIALFEKLCDAVQHAHSNLVLHLDIKPANVLIESNGTPHLLDFGITRLMSDPEIGHRAFTPDYASPEQVTGEPPTAASDVYSLGVLLYRLLTGRDPFASDSEVPTETQLADREQLEADVSVAAPAPGIDTDLLAILRKAMAYSVVDRYRTVGALLTDLERYRDHLPVAARPKTPGYAFAKYLRRHAVALSVAGSIFAILLAFGIREVQLRTEAQRARAEAEAAYAQAELEAETLRQVSEFLTNLFRVSNPGEARGNTVTARELLDRGAERIERELGDQPVVRTRLMRTMADVYSSLGLYDAATDLDERALTASLERLGPDHPDVAETLSALGALYRHQSRYEESADAHRRALTVREAVFGPEHPVVAESLNGLAQAEWYLGEPERAEQHYRRALAIRTIEFGPNSVEVATTLVHLGWLLDREERFDEAEDVLSRSLAIRDKELGGDHFSVAENLDLLAQVNMTRQRYDEAEVQLLRALLIRRKVLEPSHPDIGMSLLSVGRLYRAQARYDDALANFRQAETHFAGTLGHEHYQVAAVLEDIGLVLAEKGEWAEAETAYRRQLAILESTLSPEHVLVGAALNNLGWVLSDGLGRYTDGEAVLRRAVGLFTQNAEPDDYWNALSRWSLANNLRDQRQFNEAVVYYGEAQAILERTGGSERVGNPSLDELLTDVAKLEAAR
ncbi:MAG: serine/threonine-protein kinase [Pseudomonadota bacterium]